MIAFGWVDDSRCSTDAFASNLSKEERMMMSFGYFAKVVAVSCWATVD